jgi:hypothetical protein
MRLQAHENDMQFRECQVCAEYQKLILKSHTSVFGGVQFHHSQERMKPYLEHIAASKEGSWTLFDRRLPAIPFEWHYNSEYELTLTLNSRGQRFVGDSIAPYEDGDLVLIGPKIPHTWCSSDDCAVGITHQALVLWFSEGFVQSLIKPHLELRPIQILLESSTRAVQFSESVRAKARIIICNMLDQTAEDRLPVLLQLLLVLARDTRALPLTSSSVDAMPGAVSTGRCNTGLEFTSRSFKVQSLSRALIEAQGYLVEVGLRVAGQVGFLREVLSQQTVGVFVGAALPGLCGSQK